MLRVKKICFWVVPMFVIGASFAYAQALLHVYFGASHQPDNSVEMQVADMEKAQITNPVEVQVADSVEEQAEVPVAEQASDSVEAQPVIIDEMESEQSVDSVLATPVTPAATTTTPVQPASQAAVTPVMAGATPDTIILKNVSPESEAFFVNLMPKEMPPLGKDTEKAFKDSWAKRFSFHFNTLEWAATIPNFGIEFDLNKTEKNNRSLLLFAKKNGTIKYNYNPKLIFNVEGARVEFRKYWRTGSVGKGDYKNHPQIYDIPRITLKDAKKVRKETISFNEQLNDNDTIITWVYANANDSALAQQYNGDRSRGALYNRYHQFRRNVTSTRTYKQPHNMRAYYLGGYVGYEHWNVCFNKKGRQGNSIIAGASLGWSFPIMNRKYPSEGGLDLDCGALVGLKMVRYDAYRYNSESMCYAKDFKHSHPSWGIGKVPLHEIRIGLVYRFRSISRKVSLSLVDDYYQKWVEDANAAKQKRQDAEVRRTDSLNEVKMASRIKGKLAADSASYANEWHRMRLANAMRLNPDTVFTEFDDTLYMKIFKGVDMNDQKRLKEYNDSVARDNKHAAAQAAANQKKAEAEAQKKAKADAKKAKAESKKANAAKKESTEQPDAPDNPVSPEVPEVPDTPDSPDAPDKPDKPDNPDTPDTSDSPDTPDVPDNPDTPDTPTQSEETINR